MMEEDDAIVKYLRTMWLWKNLLQQKNAGSSSSRGAAGGSDSAGRRTRGRRRELKREGKN